MGFRADFLFIWDDYPFFTQPYIILRGIPSMRYQNKIVTVLETEERWDFSRRWSLIGFALAFVLTQTLRAAHSNPVNSLRNK
jgi:hypothetical protein